MTPTEKLLNSITYCTEVAKRNLDDYAPAVRPAQQVAIREAKDALVHLYDEYTAYFCKVGVAIFIFGDRDEQAKFAQVAEEDLHLLTVQADALYNRLSDDIWPSVGGGGEYTAVQHRKLLLGLREVAEELNVEHMEYPGDEFYASVQTKEALTEHVRNLVRAATGDLLNAAYIEREVVKAAIEAENAGNVIPVVVVGATSAETKGLATTFGKGNTTITITETVTKESVAAHINNAKKSIFKISPTTKKNS